MGEARNGTFTASRDRIGGGRVYVGKFEHAVKANFKHAETDFQRCPYFRVRQTFEIFAARNAVFQRLNVVERVPYGLPGCSDSFFSDEVHALHCS
ncbi:hypothetical protein D3C72_2027000 [compost metagenome]